MSKSYGWFSIRNDGYVSLKDGRSGRLMHTLVAEMALGKPLPKGSIVHHVDGNKKNNFSSNLVICPDQAYHKLIHQREAALKESGDANNLKCKFCKQYDRPENLRIYQGTRAGQKSPTKNIHHIECNKKYLREWYKRRITK